MEGVSKMIGFRMQIIGPDEIKRINPFVDTKGVIAGAWTLDDGHVDPAGCCNALAKGARDMGAEIIRNNRVLEINQLPSGEWQVVTEQGTVTCEHVVNAAGCYARKVAEMAGADVPITNMKHHYIVTDPIQEFLDRDEEMVVMRDPYPSSYYRQEQKAGLDMRTVESLLKGSKDGPVVKAGDPEASLLVQKIAKGEMPPKRDLVKASVKPVREGELEIIRKWIAAGMPLAEPSLPRASAAAARTMMASSSSRSDSTVT